VSEKAVIRLQNRLAPRDGDPLRQGAAGPEGPDYIVPLPPIPAPVPEDLRM